MTNREHWQIDKRIPVAVLATTLIQSAVIVWWAATADARLSAVEKRQEATDSLLITVARLDANLVSFKDEFKDFKTEVRAAFKPPK